MNLPTTWCDKIFQKLTLAYGRDFTGRWEGIPLIEVKSDWAHELAGYQDAPHAISYALQNLPVKPPTVYEFRAICQRAQTPPAPRLNAPMADPAVVRKAIAEARALLTRASS